MGIHYRREDLYKLRESPLVVKPANLPPIEDWMGIQENNARRPNTSRGKHEDSSLQPDYKRTALLDNGKKTSAGNEEAVRKERSTFRERFGNGSETAEGNNDRKDGRFDALNGKRMGRYEKDDAKPRRRIDEDDVDGKSRRDLGDRTRWGPRSFKDENDARDDEDAGRAGPRHDREKFQQPWLRGARIPDSNEDSRRDERKPPDWRRGDRVEGRGWDRNDRFEAEPEWMAAGDDDEDPLQAKTMEDFEQWKQRMKTGGAPPTEPKPEPHIEHLQGTEEQVTKTRAATRSAQDDAMDKFYASFGAQKLDAVKQEVPTKTPAKSRFANMFGAPVEVPAKLPTPPMPAAPPQIEHVDRPTSSTQATMLGNADQEGFQRILQMLQTRSNNTTPQNRRPGSSRASTQRIDETSKLHDLQQRPIMDASRAKSPQDDQPRRPNESMLEGLLNIRSPPAQTHQRQESSNPDERQLLLQLLGQADNREQKRNQMMSADPRQMPGLQAAYSNMNQQASAYNQQLAAGVNSRQHVRQERPPSFFDEPPFFNTVEPTQLRRRPTNEHSLPPFFDEAAYRHSLRHNGQQPPTSEQMQGPPPGLGRPPGFDQIRGMPGFATQQQQQQARQAGPPPGIPNISMQQRGLPAQFQPPMPMPSQPQQQPGPPRRKHTGEGPGFPPGMRPPPGFMQAGPPPDFAAMAQNYGRYQIGNEQQGPPQDLHDSRYGAGRSSGMPGPYR